MLKRDTTFNELVITNNFVKNKTIFILMDEFHLAQRQISLQKQPPEVFWKKGVLSNFGKITGKHLYQNLFLNKVAGFSLWEERHWHKRFHGNYVKFLRIPFLQDTSGWLLLLWLHYYEKKEPFTTKYLSHEGLSAWRKSCSGSNLRKRCSMLFMFSRLNCER